MLERLDQASRAVRGLATVLMTFVLAALWTSAAPAAWVTEFLAQRQQDFNPQPFHLPSSWVETPNPEDDPDNIPDSNDLITVGGWLYAGEKIDHIQVQGTHAVDSCRISWSSNYASKGRLEVGLGGDFTVINELAMSGLSFAPSELSITGSLTVNDALSTAVAPGSRSTVYLHQGGTLRAGHLAKGDGTLEFTWRGGSTIGNVGGRDLTIGSGVDLGLADSTEHALMVDSGRTAFIHGTFSDLTSDDHWVDKTGPGTAVLYGSNTLRGGMRIDGGTLRLGGSNKLLDTSDVLVLDGTFDLDGYDETIGRLHGSGEVALGPGALTVGADDDSSIFQGVIRGDSSSRFIKTGTGTMGLAGANTYTGQTRVEMGTLALEGASERLNDATHLYVAGGAVFDMQGHDETIDSLTGLGGVLPKGGTLTVGASGGSSTFAGRIFGAGGLRKVGTGSLTLSGSNMYGGPTSIDAGSLIVSGLLPQATDVHVEGGAVLDLDGHGQTIDALTGSGSVVNNDNRLVVGAFDGSGTFSGVIRGAGRLRKIGTGTQVLSGANLYTGVTDVYEGTLQLGDSERIANASVLWVQNLGTLDLAGYSETIDALAGDGSVSLGAGTLLLGAESGSATFSGTISGSGGVTKLGAGVQAFTGDHTYTGPTDVIDGTLVNHGTLVGDAFVSQAVLEGSGHFGAVSFDDAGVFSPGDQDAAGSADASSGMWGDAGIYRWHVASATGTAGTDWDLWYITGQLLNAQGAKLEIVGDPADFDNSADHSWLIAQTDEATSLASFVTGWVDIDASGFVPSTGGGGFSLAVQDNGLYLQFGQGDGAVPAPSVLVGLLGLAAVGLARSVRARRRRGRAQPSGIGLNDS